MRLDDRQKPSLEESVPASGTRMNLSERFASSRGRPVEVNGVIAVPILQIPCQGSDTFRVRLATPTGRSGQGVALSVKRGSVTVNGESSKDVVLWRATAPEEVIVAVHTRRKAALWVWNCWRGAQDQTMAWLGNSGMVVEHAGGRWRLECSDGKGDAAFDDLLVEISRAG